MHVIYFIFSIHLTCPCSLFYEHTVRGLLAINEFNKDNSTQILPVPTDHVTGEKALLHLTRKCIERQKLRIQASALLLGQKFLGPNIRTFKPLDDGKRADIDDRESVNILIGFCLHPNYLIFRLKVLEYQYTWLFL